MNEPIGGTFTLIHGERETEAIPHEASGFEILNALDRANIVFTDAVVHGRSVTFGIGDRNPPIVRVMHAACFVDGGDL